MKGKPVATVEPSPGAAGPAARVLADGLPGDAGSANPPNHVLRSLKKWNAMTAQAAEAAGVTGMQEPVKNPDSGGRKPGITGIVSAVGEEPVPGSRAGLRFIRRRLYL